MGLKTVLDRGQMGVDGSFIKVLIKRRTGGKEGRERHLKFSLYCGQL